MRIRSVHDGYRLTTPFGYVPDYPLNKGFHKGVDYVHSDRQIIAPQDSVVSSVGYDEANGNYLILESNGFRDWFSHIANQGYRVTIGKVKQGQLLAIMGDTGYADGVHSHHSLRVNGVLVDAENYISDNKEDMTQDAVEKLVMYAYRASTDIDATPEQAGYWVSRIMHNNNTAYELLSALGGNSYKGDPQFRNKARNYDKDVADASGGYKETKVYIKG